MSKLKAFPMVGVRLPAGVCRRLRAMARRRKVLLSDLLRDAILALLDE